ncbi:hypothetical protein AB0A74_01200 [Saccharothrix sp. NPDC042600]|uniref:hypothetical protein n=1 Tax=Saccharothrix TaxID=2071 RepID=UPI0033F65AEA|nr:hypothetical protein GCM10017745_49480 [Saccharothrix mutabilis subsp. capreolus]
MSSRHVLRPGAVAGADRTALLAAHRTYASEFGWPVALNGDSVDLFLDGAVRAVEVRAGFACEVAGLLWASAPLGPVLSLPGESKLLWVFLVAPDGDGVGPAVPPGVRLLSSRHTVPLPPSRVRGGEVGWVNRPDPAQPRLPGLRTVFTAARVAQRPHRW